MNFNTFLKIMILRVFENKKRKYLKKLIIEKDITIENFRDKGA